MRRQGRRFTVLLAAVGGIALVVGGVGIMNVMLISVSERRGEIGLRRAVGARRRDIRRQFVLEAVLLCTTGGLLGIGAGVTAAWGICLYTGWPFSVSVEAMVVGVGVSTGAGLLFGVYPALPGCAAGPHRGAEELRREATSVKGTGTSGPKGSKSCTARGNTRRRTRDGPVRERACAPCGRATGHRCRWTREGR